MGGDAPSVINGSLKSNGNVMVINPNGMLFGGKASVDVNGIIASTADADNASFMNGGSLNLNKLGNPNAAIINLGHIKAKDGGHVGMLAPNLSNQGVIEAKLGKVQLASGDTATLDIYGDGLINAAVSDKVTSQLIENEGIIAAEGGSIAITAAAGDRIVDSLINLGGVLDARSVGSKSGTIKVQADGVNAVKGNLTKDKGKKTGSSNVYVSGIIDTSGRNAGEHGGLIQILGDKIALLAGAFLDASGDTGKSGTTLGKDKSAVREGSAGGDIRIGGDYLGLGETPTAKNLYVDPNAFVVNDALESGDAGRSIFWSDGTTQFYGNVFARALGGMGVDPVTGSAITTTATDHRPLTTGDGGFVETSGHGHLDAGGYVDLTASSGNRGTYFLDPTDITIYGNVDPAFQSTDGSINLNANLKLWLDASDTSTVQLTYSTDSLGGTTTSGATGSNSITTSADVSTLLTVGSRIRLNAAGAVTTANTLGADTYTIASISGTTITTVESLTQMYAAGTSLYRGLVSQWRDKSSQGNNLLQALDNLMPQWKAAYGLNLAGVEFIAATNDLLSANLNVNPSNGMSLILGEKIGGNWIASGTPIASVGGLTVQKSNGNQLDVGFNGITTGYTIPEGTFVDTLLSVVGSSGALGVYQDGRESFSSAGVATPGGLGSYTFDIRSAHGNPPAFPTGSVFREVILLNQNASLNARNILEQYYAAKWNKALDPVAGAGTEVAEATGATGYSAFTTRYLERLSQTADISLQATNNITLDLKTDTLALANNRNLTLTAGNQINTASAGTITTTGTGTINFNGADYNQLHALTLNGAGGTTITADTVNIGANLAGTGILTFANKTANTTIGLGTGAGVLNISNAELGNIQSGRQRLVFGSINSGDMVIATTKDFVNTDVSFVSGNDISLNGNLTKATGAGTANYLMQANRNILNAGSAGVTASTGSINLTLNSDYDQATVLGGAIYLTGGTFTSNGGNIIMGGGSNPTTGFAAGSTTTNPFGVYLQGGNSFNAGGGNIQIRGQGFNDAAGGRVGVLRRQYSRLVLDAQSRTLDFRGVFGGFHLEFDARYAGWLFAILESQVPEGALEVVGTVDFVWSASS